jgi:polysaccharide biosynthesis protein PslH
MPAEYPASQRLMIVAARDPWPARRGDQLRTLQFARALAAEWRVTLLAPGTGRSADAAESLPPGVSVVRYRRTVGDRLFGLVRAAFAGEPLQAGLYASRDLRRRLSAETEACALVLVQLVRSRHALRALAGGSLLSRAPVVVDFIDCLSLAFEKRAELDAFWRRSVLREEARLLARAERETLELAAAAVVVCARDREAMSVRAGAANAAKLSVLPLSVEPGGPTARSDPGARPVLALTGNLGYFVNKDAVLFFLDAVWPVLRRSRPELRLVVAGARPGRLEARVRHAGAELVADPADLRSVLASATVALAPLRCGAGVPVKILEAWQVGTPVVASPWAAAGTIAAPERELLVASEVLDWQRQISRLLDDRGLRERLAAAGRAAIEREHSPDGAATAIREWVRGVVSRAPGR